MRRRSLVAAALVAISTFAACARRADDDQVHVAVAASFSVPFDVIARQFEASTGHRVVVSTGSTGGLYAQIAAGAPFEAFLAADEERPRRLVDEGRAVAESRFTYARGRLALWWPRRTLTDGRAVLAGGEFARLAMANPATAPYGRAARQVIESLGAWPAVEPKVVLGNDVGQVYQFVATRNAELGFVARSQLDRESAAVAWLVPEELHAPIEQQAVLLATGAADPAARQLLEWLRGDEAREVIERFGFGSER